MKKVFIRKHHPSHPWIFSNELKRADGVIEPGEVVDVYKGKVYLGRGFYNPHSLIAVRRYSDGSVDFDQVFVDRSIASAWEYRKRYISDSSFRLVFSEADNLPGLIIDKYEDNFVIQIHCYGMEMKKDLIINSLIEFQPGFIYEKDDSYLRTLEGLKAENRLLYGNISGPIIIVQDGIKFYVDIEKGQKTGFYFDLRAIRNWVRDNSRGRRLLDLFCYTGGFSLYGARGGALAVLGIDSSRYACELARKNAVLNNFTNIEFSCSDVFEFLRSDRNFYDMIILDPPSFTRSKREVFDALRGYKEVNLQAMKRLKKGGILVTTCCSYHIDEANFYKVLRQAALDARVNLRVIGRAIQSPDHPIVLNMPESFYLKAFYLLK